MCKRWTWHPFHLHTRLYTVVYELCLPWRFHLSYSVSPILFHHSLYEPWRIIHIFSLWTEKCFYFNFSPLLLWIFLVNTYIYLNKNKMKNIKNRNNQQKFRLWICLQFLWLWVNECVCVCVQCVCMCKVLIHTLLSKINYITLIFLIMFDYI